MDEQSKPEGKQTIFLEKRINKEADNKSEDYVVLDLSPKNLGRLLEPILLLVIIIALCGIIFWASLDLLGLNRLQLPTFNQPTTATDNGNDFGGVVVFDDEGKPDDNTANNNNMDNNGQPTTNNTNNNSGVTNNNTDSNSGQATTGEQKEGDKKPGNIFTEDDPKESGGISTQKEVTYAAHKGEGVTHLARKAMLDYLKDKGVNLNASQKLFFETTLTQAHNPQWLNPGETRTFAISELQDLMTRAQNLSQRQQNLWARYL